LSAGLSERHTQFKFSENGAPQRARGSRGFGLRCDFCLERPFDPGHQGFYVCGFDSSTAPNAQPRRSITIGTDVKSHSFSVQSFGHSFCKARTISDPWISEL
jgi:hypothetical protein